jgi:hypothetical protein
MSNAAPLVFKRPWWIVAVANLLIIFFVFFSIWLTVYTLFFFHATPKDNDVVGDRLVSLGLLTVSPYFIWLRIFLGDIHIDNDGIGWWSWGRRRRYIRWTDVKIMTIDTISTDTLQLIHD